MGSKVEWPRRLLPRTFLNAGSAVAVFEALFTFGALIVSSRLLFNTKADIERRISGGQSATLEFKNSTGQLNRAGTRWHPRSGRRPTSSWHREEIRGDYGRADERFCA